MRSLPRQYIGSFELLPRFSWIPPQPKTREPMPKRSRCAWRSGLGRKRHRGGHGRTSCFGWAGGSSRSSNPRLRPLQRATGQTMPSGLAECSAEVSRSSGRPNPQSRRRCSWSQLVLAWACPPRTIEIGNDSWGSETALMVAPQPALAPPPQFRPAPTTRALSSESVAQEVRFGAVRRQIRRPTDGKAHSHIPVCGSRTCLPKHEFPLNQAIRCLLFLAHSGPTGFNPRVIRERS